MPKSLVKSPSPGVRFSATTRRKPQQSRAKVSSEALQEAFVRVLLERGYERVTVREVAAVAGVGIGTFYEYVANKEALAALTIHMRVKQQAHAFQASIERNQGKTRAAIAKAIIHDQMDLLMSEAETWLALLVLERRISSPEVYRKYYDQYVALWRQAFTCASDPMHADKLDACARMVHAIMYGWTVQNLMTQGPGLDIALMKQEVERAVHAYLDTI